MQILTDEDRFASVLSREMQRMQILAASIQQLFQGDRPLEKPIIIPGAQNQQTSVWSKLTRSVVWFNFTSTSVYKLLKINGAAGGSPIFIPLSERQKPVLPSILLVAPTDTRVSTHTIVQ